MHAIFQVYASLDTS